ncbi:MAG: hypothetical protein HC908_14235, partial [Calothrix sp. SM1_7_51]|nr:hypothetical protein [Calothrix sp. SM1_7_51]
MALGCVAADVGVQVSVRGSKTPSQQRNNVSQNIQPGCVGNSVTTVGNQTYVGPGRVQQTATVAKHWVVLVVVLVLVMSKFESILKLTLYTYAS